MDSRRGHSKDPAALEFWESQNTETKKFVLEMKMEH